MNQTNGIHAYDKPVENDFEYVYAENKDKGFIKVTKSMMKVLLGIATKLSELENDKGFVDNTVANLENYYLKTETYSKDELDDKLSLVPRFSVQVVTSLPVENISDTTVYLVPANEDEDNLYTEYINVNGLWEILGAQKIPKFEVTKGAIEDALGYTPADNEKVGQLEATISNQAEVDEKGIVSFKNAQGLTLFTLDLSSFGVVTTYGNIVTSVESLTVGEGSTGTFTVKLDKAPSEAQTVYLAVSDTALLSVSPATLTFTPNNWETPQTVTVTALQDEDDYDNEITVALTSKTVDAKEVVVTISDDDRPNLVTDGLVLEWDFRGLTGDVATDTVGGVEIIDIVDTEFAKLENGLACGNNSTKYAYAHLVTDSEAYTEFVSKMKEANSRGFTVEMFGMAFPNTFETTNAKFFAVGSNNGYSAGTNSGIKSGSGKMPYKTTDGESATIAEAVNMQFENGILSGYIQVDQQKFAHMANVYNADGSIDRYMVGYKNRTANAAPEDFASWDLETALACTNTTNFLGNRLIYYNNGAIMENYYITFVRFYNRPLTQEELAQNIEYNKACLGISAF